MSHLSPTTITSDEQSLILRATQPNLRDHLIISLALGTGLRLAEIVGLDVGDVYGPDGTPRVRVHPEGDRQGRPGGRRVSARSARREAEEVLDVEASTR